MFILVESFILILLMANSGGNKAFKSGTKKILYNIIKYCDQEAENREIIIPITQPTKRAN